jgi:hypothetical protein
MRVGHGLFWKGFRYLDMLAYGTITYWLRCIHQLNCHVNQYDQSSLELHHAYVVSGLLWDLPILHVTFQC